jgi:hypothetical protein
MITSNSPEEYYERLGAAETKIVDNWNEKRSALLQSIVSKSISDSLQNVSHSERTSLPYVRMLVTAFCNLKQKGRRHARTEQKTAELIIWRVSDEQISRIKEGVVLRMKNLGVKADRNGRLQLSAKTETQMESLIREPTQYELIQSGYEERRPKSFIRITLMSKKQEPSRLAREVDVVGCIVKINRLDDNTSSAYLTDESGFVMKIIRTHRAQNNNPFHLGNVDQKLPAVVAFCNIEVTSFDTREQCALSIWSTSSCKAKHSMRSRCEEIQTWCNSAPGIEHCSTVLDRINARIPTCAGPFNRFRVCLGYVLGFDECEPILEANGMNVIIDYGEEFPLTARLPFHLFSDVLQLTQSNSTADASGVSSVGTEKSFGHEEILSNYISLSDYFQRNQTLFHFSLELPSFYGDEVQVPLVTGVSIADADTLSRLHLTQ